MIDDLRFIHFWFHTTTLSTFTSSGLLTLMKSPNGSIRFSHVLQNISYVRYNVALTNLFITWAQLAYQAANAVNMPIHPPVCVALLDSLFYVRKRRKRREKRWAYANSPIVRTKKVSSNKANTTHMDKLTLIDATNMYPCIYYYYLTLLLDFLP